MEHNSALAITKHYIIKKKKQKRYKEQYRALQEGYENYHKRNKTAQIGTDYQLILLDRRGRRGSKRHIMRKPIAMLLFKNHKEKYTPVN